jgi:hypothetical protein
VIEHLNSIGKALSLIPNMARKKRESGPYYLPGCNSPLSHPTLVEQFFIGFNSSVLPCPLVCSFLKAKIMFIAQQCNHLSATQLSTPGFAGVMSVRNK